MKRFKNTGALNNTNKNEENIEIQKKYLANNPNYKTIFTIK